MSIGQYTERETDPKASGEDAGTTLLGTPNLRRALPDHLSEMRRLGVVRIIFSCKQEAHDHLEPRFAHEYVSLTNFVCP